MGLRCKPTLFYKLPKQQQDIKAIMDGIRTILWLVNIFSALAIIFLVLMQQGKGADAGAAFGGGSAQGVFGASGSANFLSRSTSVAAVIFFITCLMLAYASSNRQVGLDFSDVNVPPAKVQTAPANPQPTTPKPVIPE